MAPPEVASLEQYGLSSLTDLKPEGFEKEPRGKGLAVEVILGPMHRALQSARAWDCHHHIALFML